jgi:putative photosynthetic complex assembly protein
MSHDHRSDVLPRPALIAAGAVIALTIAGAAVSLLSGVSQNDAPTAAPVISRDLLFRDRADGAILVFDAHDMSAPIEVVAPQTNGFLRGAMRGLAQQRIRQDADRDIPFRLTEWADNRLTLEDPTTHRRLELEAFGKTNEEVFVHLLTAKAGS